MSNQRKSPGGCERFVAAASDAGLEVHVRTFPQGTHTAAQAAAAVGCELSQIVKSLVFKCDDQPVLALTSGSKRVDTAALGELFDGKIERASARTVRSATGYAIGGTPPFGHSQPLRTALDATLLNYETVWAAAGTAKTVFEIPTADLARLSSATIGDFTE